MITVRTPLRVSFCGGGSDLPAFYRRHTGKVISAGLNRYVYLTIHPSFDKDKIHCRYSKNELVDDAGELEHPIFRELLQQFGINGVEITSNADVPSGTGLGSSSSFTVALLHLLYSYRGKLVSPERLAREACHVELEILKEPIGKQDQYAAAFGGLNLFRFHPDESVQVEPLLMSREALQRMERNLLMFYTGDIRSASAILSEQSKNVLRDADKEKAQLRIADLVESLYTELSKERIDSLGSFLHENWLAKRELASGITNELIDKAYGAALAAGATGGKLLGAGGGGFLLFYVPEHRHSAVKNALSALRYMPFGFSGGGSSIIYVGDKYWD
jgi:D-glycero-alpha-D-manno-heptose-7-phosphate kinase